MQRSTGKRDKAILLTLLDTGLRAGELCVLRIADVDMKSGRIQVRAGEAGKAKGGKGRIVFIGKSARRSLWRYLAEREDGDDPDVPCRKNQNPGKERRDDVSRIRELKLIGYINCIPGFQREKKCNACIKRYRIVASVRVCDVTLTDD